LRPAGPSPAAIPHRHTALPRFLIRLPFIHLYTSPPFSLLSSTSYLQFRHSYLALPPALPFITPLLPPPHEDAEFFYLL
jgi:hypothetical protein